MRLTVLLMTVAAAGCGAPTGPGNETTAGAPAPTRAADPPGEAPAQTAASDGVAAEPENRFVSCPGHPRCPKNQEGY